ncbi:Alpha/Beta hydrolase protein [Boletus edulis]|uniref:Alpha/Beta hydrolase protein n=1 Tax=Boletus edulis BED1 TaxID=1328754 RepID=A0AAD4BP09_BOLED|nr:Alpha/Beta hydrolase protein [Boletus edulis]KAF8436230.1 Alpha/Beta hydrolase protein [Boletus edulis BED1]
MSKYLPSLESFAKGAIATTAGVTTIGCGLLYYGQNYLIYPSAFPPGSRTDVDTPTKYGMVYEDLALRTEDGITLRSYLLMQRKEISHTHALQVDWTDDQSNEDFAATRPTVIMFHGNGGNHGHRIPLARIFFVKMRCNVLMLSYRGYGLSEGSPSETGLCIDAQTALDYVTSHPYLQKTPVILYGQSIGGAVAIHLASRNPSKISALILENTFTNLPRLVPHALPFLSPLTFLCHQKWDSASKIPFIPKSTPILMLSGVQDEVVPREHMQELWEIITRRQGSMVQVDREPKANTSEIGRGKSNFVEFPHGCHNDTCVQQGYWTEVTEFMASLSRL